MTTRSKSNPRWWIWGPLLAVAGWLALFADKTPISSTPAVVSPSQKPTQSNSKPRQAVKNDNVGLTPLIPRDQLIPSKTAQPGTTRDLFTGRSWTPAPAPTEVIAMEPMAPPVPFTYLGKQQEGKEWRVFLGLANQTHIVSEGSIIDNLYRVDSINGNTLNMTYIPLGQSQSISIGEIR